MIRIKDSLLLSYAKLRTRKIRLGITVAISALLFACLVFVAIITAGVIHSVKDFSTEGYGGRYLVQAIPLSLNATPESNQQLINQLKPANDDIIKQKKALAKKLELPYDETNDQTLPLYSYKNGAQLDYFPNYSSKIAQAAISKLDASITGTSYQDFVTTAKNAGAINTYRGSSAGGNASGQQSYVSVLTNGKENLDSLKSGIQRQSGEQSFKGVQTIITMGWRTLDNELMLPFVLPGQSLATGKDGSIPSVVPMSVAEEALNLKSLPETASAKDRLDRLDFVRKHLPGTTAQLCYRNSYSTDLLSQAIQQDKDIANNKNNKDYTPPSLIYAVPTEACAPITVKSDKRTADEKKQADNQKAFDRQFGQETEQVQGLLTVRLVGITPDANFGSGGAISASTILSSLFSSSIGNGWVSPTGASQNNTIANTIQTGSPDGYTTDRGMYYAEFKDLKSMKRFIDDQTCKDTASTNTPQGAIIIHSNQGAGQSNFIQSCINQHKVFNVMSYGNSAGAIEEFRAGIWKTMRIVVLAVVIIAALIMMGNVGKIIADSRRETAVFRALGASRLGISQVYLGYTLMLSLLVAIAALILGSIGAYIISQRFEAGLSTTAVLTFNASDIHKHFSLFGLDPVWLLGIAGLVVLSGLLSAIIPLLTNMRRNPIRDMRNDS